MKLFDIIYLNIGGSTSLSGNDLENMKYRNTKIQWGFVKFELCSSADRHV